MSRRESDPTSILPASSHLEIKSFHAAADRISFHDACTIRFNVFVVEQGFSQENEFDKVDETCVHLLAYYVSPEMGGRSVPVGTLRIEALPNSTVAKISRVAVMKPHRNQGVAKRLLSVAENVARNMGMTKCTLHSQSDKKIVYEKFGYRISDVPEHNESQDGNEELFNLSGINNTGMDSSRVGEFLEEGVWHVKMYKDIFPAT